MILDDWRYSKAFSFGKWEHLFSRVLGLILVLISIVIIIREKRLSPKDLEYMWLCATCLWLLYFISHRLEKWFFPN